MKLRRVQNGNGAAVQIATAFGWADADAALAMLAAVPARGDVVALLGMSSPHRAEIQAAAETLPATSQSGPSLLPFEPRSYRDFMLYERHAIDAARGFVRRFVPGAWPVVRAYELLTRATFPALKPKPLWYRQPIFYMGNHLAFATDGEAIEIPSYSQALDYELELGFVLAHPLLDATPAEAEAAIGGFVVFNDFSARDVQLDEMASGFGPQKSKHFRNAISPIVVSADAILPRWQSLKGSVRINGTLVSEPRSGGARWSLGEALAHVSRSERLFPGEFFATGTLAGGSGIETGRLLTAGDTIEIGIDGVGTLTNTIVGRKDRSS
jgi:2-keto-4-pentenoate hydratase/2-oxohepta-3-ene-1,7-dioic acid hydratase in catechol pathway